MEEKELERMFLHELLEEKRRGTFRNPSCRLSDEQKIEIVKVYLTGNRTVDAIAADFGVSRKSIFRWINKFAGGKTEARASRSRVSRSSATEAAGDKTIVKTPSQKIYMAKKSVPQEDAEVSALKAEVARLQREVELANYKVHVRDVMIEEAEKTFNIPIRKKSGTEQ